jgi:hypothetical protein
LSSNDLVKDQGELALSIEYDLVNHTTSLEACAILPDNTLQDKIVVAYVSLCDLASSTFDSLFLVGSPENFYNSEFKAKIGNFPCISPILGCFC